MYSNSIHYKILKSPQKIVKKNLNRVMRDDCAGLGSRRAVYTVETVFV